jgi:hypothetical protein
MVTANAKTNPNSSRFFTSSSYWEKFVVDCIFLSTSCWFAKGLFKVRSKPRVCPLSVIPLGLFDFFLKSLCSKVKKNPQVGKFMVVFVIVQTGFKKKKRNAVAISLWIGGKGGPVGGQFFPKKKANFANLKQ